MHITRWGKKRAKEWEKIWPKLEVADIILTHDASSALSGIIRKVTDSYWNHSLLVFFTKKNKYFFKNILFVSAEDHGIELHRMQRYTNHFDYIDIGVKRVPGLNEELQKKIAKYMLNNIDIPYDYTRLLGLLVKFASSRISGSEEHLKSFLTNKDAFVCSSFLQKAFYESVPPEMKQAVLFKKGSSEKELEELTPSVIARSEACEWIYNPHD